MVERTQAKNSRVEQSLTGEATLPTSIRHRIAPPVPPVCSMGTMFCITDAPKKEAQNRTQSSLSPTPERSTFGNARVGAGKICEQNATIFGHASTMRKAAVSPSDVVCHLTLRDAPLYWVDAPYCPKSEVHGRSESFSSHNFTTSQNVMLQGIV